jgi:hypothetical protein
MRRCQSGRQRSDTRAGGSQAFGNNAQCHIGRSFDVSGANAGMRMKGRYPLTTRVVKPKTFDNQRPPGQVIAAFLLTVYNQKR